MNWDEDALQAIEVLPVPPMMTGYARLQAEKIARHKGHGRVTMETVAETEQLYRVFVGEEKTQELRAFMQGTGPAPEMEEELFFDDDGVLYHIETCYTKYGESTKEVRDLLKDVKRDITALMDGENLTEIMADLSPEALHGASRFNVVMTGCPNCCVSPYLRDFGIIMLHRVAVTDSQCTSCGRCVKICFDKAVSLTDRGPVIDEKKCVLCGLCARDCPTGTLAEKELRFRVVAGGSGARHPVLAVPIESFVRKDRVLELLRNTIARLRDARPGETLRDIIQREGPGALRGRESTV